MFFDESDSELLKTWVIQKLSDVSDADSDVLADYVLALVKTDEPEAVAKANCVENLQDFLGDKSKSFVDDVFAAIAAKSYDLAKAPVKASAPIYQPPRRMSLDPPQQQNQSRKRSYHDWDRTEPQNGRIESFDGGERPVKQPRRGGRGGADSRGARQQHPYGGASYNQQPQALVLPPMPPPPPGMPPFDPNNPMAALFAMQQAMGMLPVLPSTGSFQTGNPSTQRCRDYDTKGFCARGASCPFEHGNDYNVIPPPTDEYDPNNAALLNITPNRTGLVNTSAAGRSRGGRRGRGGSNPRGGKRAHFSQQGPQHDSSVTAVVVEQIPEEKLDEQSVRDFFSEFGNIEEVNLQPYKRLAVVKYDSNESAKAAYESPKVVFDNRFVKVYWYKSDNSKLSNGQHGSNGTNRNTGDVEMAEEELEIDPVEFAKKQEEAQRRHEEQKKQREEAEGRRRELDTKMQAIELERKKMAETLAKKAGGKASTHATESTLPESTGESEKTKGLKAQLAKLEAEAKTLGIDPESATAVSPYPYRGRGGFRGRPRGRGGYNASFRGRWPGAHGGAVMRLDNRPKTICVTFSEGEYENHEEDLRQFLLFNGSESATLNKDPGRKDAALIAFPERYLGETFMAAAASPDFPLTGKAELSWHKSESTVSVAPEPIVRMEMPMENLEGQDASSTRDTDSYDVADEDDRWG